MTICPDCLSRADALRVNGVLRCKCGRFARELHEARAAADANDELPAVLRIPRGQVQLRLVGDVGRLAGAMGKKAEMLRELDAIAGRCAAIRRALEV